MKTEDSSSCYLYMYFPLLLTGRTGFELPFVECTIKDVCDVYRY